MRTFSDVQKFYIINRRPWPLTFFLCALYFISRRYIIESFMNISGNTLIESSVQSSDISFDSGMAGFYILWYYTYYSDIWYVP